MPEEEFCDPCRNHRLHIHPNMDAQMSEQKTALEKLPVLRDDPLFLGSESFDPSLDAFNHEAYARAILKILIQNNPPLSIGLFGPWGIGKSTIVSILFKLIAQESSRKLKPIYFNAWKYSGDSFRRQFLIEVAKQVYEGHAGRDAQIRRLEQLNYTDVLREDAQKGLLDQVKEVLKANVKLREPGLARILLALVVLLVGGVVAAFAKSIYPFLPSAFAALLLFFLRLKFEDLFVIQENTVYDPKLIFPEQFEAEFRKLVDSSGSLHGFTPVVVVDDIDRCEATTIRDILISVKTFIGQENCFFVVPCDDRSIVQVFQDPNQKSGYQDELLRKYFNVGVRIAPLMATDLVDFANSVSKKTEMPASVVQIAILANYRDARKMKHFLNTFAVKYAIARARKESGFMPIDIDQTLPGFAKAVLIEDLYPELFARMVEHPEIYEILERAALGGGDLPPGGQVRGVDAELKKWGLESWMTAYPGLRSILEKTRDVKIEHVEVFLSLKTTNPEARIPRGFELKNSIVQGDESATEEIIKGISTDDARTSLAQLLLDLLNNTTDTFLKNTISASLRWYFREELFNNTDRSRIASAVTQILVYNDGQKALQQPASLALECAKNTASDYVEKLASKYEKELSQLDQPPESLPEAVNVLYQATQQPASLSAVLNGKFDTWANTEKGLSLLLQIHPPETLQKEERFPALSLLQKVAGAISPDNTDSAVATNKLRKAMIFNNWDASIAPTLAGRFFTILQQSASDAAYTPRMAFVVQSIIEKNECLEPQYAGQLWSYTQSLYSRLSDALARFEIHKAILVFAAACPETSVKQAAHSFALQNWQTFSDGQLREALDFLAKFQEQPRQALRTALIQQEFTAAQNELQNPTDRTKQRLTLCYENRGVLAAKTLDGYLIKTLETQDSAFEVWRVVIGDYAPQLGEDFAKQIAEKCLSLVTSSYSLQRRQAFFELFATVLPTLDADRKLHLLPNYFALCKHSDQNIHNPASTILGKVRKSVDEQDFKLSLNPLVRDLCRMTPTEVMTFRTVLDAALQHSALFGDNEWRDLADLTKRALPQVDTAIQDYGLLLVERMPKIPAEHEADLVHLLVGMARGSNAVQKDRVDKFLRKIPESELSAEARKTLQEYLAPPKQEDKASA